MTSVVYLLRNPVNTVSSALYSSEDPRSVVIAIEAALEGAEASSPACMFDVGVSTALGGRQWLDYDALLREIMKYARVIVL